MKPKLTIVPAEKRPYADERGRKLIESLRARLLREAVRLVREGRVGSPQDRLREASVASGIPLTLIEVELKR